MFFLFIFVVSLFSGDIYANEYKYLKAGEVFKVEVEGYFVSKAIFEELRRGYDEGIKMVKLLELYERKISVLESILSKYKEYDEKIQMREVYINDLVSSLKVELKRNELYKGLYYVFLGVSVGLTLFIGGFLINYFIFNK